MGNNKGGNDVEIHCKEVKDVLDASPPWIIRDGSTWFLLLVIMIFVSASFLKYSDIIKAPAILVNDESVILRNSIDNESIPTSYGNKAFESDGRIKEIDSAYVILNNSQIKRVRIGMPVRIKVGVSYIIEGVIFKNIKKDTNFYYSLINVKNVRSKSGVHFYPDKTLNAIAEIKIDNRPVIYKFLPFIGK